jgi:predicted Fe-Mo cluster-binding NifX family protein
MKIAVVTDDGTTISQHFGRASYYMVVTVEQGKIAKRELRDKIGHAHFASEGHDPDVPEQPHGMGPGAQSRHVRMAGSIQDCEALLCGGMGMGAYESMKQRGIRPVVTDLKTVDEAVMAYVEGRIIDQVERLH